MPVEAAGWYLDYSKQRVTEHDLVGLLAYADERGLRGAIDAMCSGAKVNVTEGRPALHVALRMPADAKLVVDGVDVVAQVHDVLARMRTFTHEAGRFRNVVNIGIGGSDLGPAMAYRALAAYGDRARQFRFVANVDGADLTTALFGLDPAQTLFVVSSKTFATLETLTNARAARRWLVDALGEAAVADHFVAVSTNRAAVQEFGIDPSRMFEFWDWVGGRYSLWSAIGLSLMIAIGPAHFDALLAGAHAMDEHFRTAPFPENMPVLMALLAHHNRNHRGFQTHAVVPYAHVLAQLPAYLEQLEMESLGKSVRVDGRPVDGDTGATVWGSQGTNGQHAYFQLLHQGTTLVPVDFIGFLQAQPGTDPHDQQPLLLANMLAQAEALAFGTHDAELPPHLVMPGGRPSSVFVATRLEPRTLGALIAAYEHKVMTLGALWAINPFDQWGVELGKQLASSLAAELQTEADAPLAHDPGTNALIERYRDARRRRR
ncbi:MAG: glucose-6-phosphate isomerase [Actinomycetota bacterium]